MECLLAVKTKSGKSLGRLLLLLRPRQALQVVLQHLLQLPSHLIQRLQHFLA